MVAMTLFLRTAAVFIGLANLAVPLLLAPPYTGITWSETFLSAVFLAMTAGLLTTELVLLLLRPALESSRLLIRYITVLGMICLGGILFGFLVPLAGLFDSSMALGDRISRAIAVGFAGALVGGVIGLVEGLILGLPLAMILSLFKRADQQQSS